MGITRLSCYDPKKYPNGHPFLPLFANDLRNVYIIYPEFLGHLAAARQDAPSDVGRHCSLQSAVDFFTPQCHGEIH